MNRLSLNIIVSLLVLFPVGALELNDAPSLRPGVEKLAAPGLHNFFRVSTNLFSGSAPEGDAAFAALAKLGIRTIITVDGTKPDIEAAHKYGLRYIHLPHGYDGISRERQISLIQAAESAEKEGGVYVHCHHGKHRGPAAVAVICEGTLGWNADESLAWMRAAGTATNYSGLFKSVHEFRMMSASELRRAPVSFPEVAKVSGLVDAMVELDQWMDGLKACRTADYKTPADHQDLNVSNLTVMIREGFREAQRLPDARKRGEEFLKQLGVAEAEVEDVEKSLDVFVRGNGNAERIALDKKFDALQRRCADCHQKFRD